MPHDNSDYPLIAKLKAPGPKRILALDGGGIRGALSLGYLLEIESILRKRYEDEDYRLCQYFDLIGGTSTGSIIAASLAKGMAVQEIIDRYLQFGPTIFSRKRALALGILQYFLKSKYKHDTLVSELNKEFAGYTLGDKRLKTGLCIVAKRADTYSTWSFHNHPDGHYFKANSGILLTDLLRASSAAPSYFVPKDLKVSGEELGVFIDGGVSSSNNPALLLFLMATLEGYPFQWEMGKDKMLIVSVGTGYHRPKINAHKKLVNRRSVAWAGELPNLFMIDANFQNQMLLQFFADSLIPQKINSEVGNMANDYITKEALLTYVRYNVQLGQIALQDLGWDGPTDDESLADLREMDHGHNAEILLKIGKLSARRIVNTSHFKDAFDFGYQAEPEALKTQKEMLSLMRPFLKANGAVFKKDRHVYAREVIKEESVTSITTSGVETTNTAEPGDFVVKNQTTAQETYIVKPDVFNGKYQFLRKTNDTWNEYGVRPEGGLVLGIELTPEVHHELGLPKHFYFEPAWGGVQYAGPGDFLVAPYQKGQDLNEVYRIGRKEFNETYTLYQASKVSNA